MDDSDVPTQRPDGRGRTATRANLTGATASRRRFLVGVAATAGFGGLAGCLGGLSDAGTNAFAENPVTEGVERRPRIGPGREETPITVVAFDDPSCPSCASLHGGAFQRIESEWVEEGRATVYSRAYYFVADWGRPAVNALVEAYRREPAAYGQLKAAYYRHQDDLSTDTVLDRTATFLDDVDAAVDPDPVVRAARERTHESLIDGDDEAAEAAGVNGVPTVFLFRAGEFVTTLGDDSFDAYESAVESHA